MEIALFGPKQHQIAAVDYLRAKLDYEATPFGLQSALAEKPHAVFLVDVRDRVSFEKEHLPGAVNIPAEEMTGRLATLPKDRVIVTYCWDITCTLAPRAALELAQKGFRVQFLAGGIAEWKHKGFRVERGF